jgi:VWFA-related protein
MQRQSSARFVLWIALSFFLFPSSSAVAQSVAPPSNQTAPASTFTTSTDLVLVPVVVRQGKQHVSSLTKDDFVILEDKVPQRIAFVKPTTTGTAYQKVGGGNVFTNQAQGSAEPPRLTILVVDNMNTLFVDQSWVVQQVPKFLADRASQHEPTAILGFTPKGIRVIHDFSTDTDSLLSSFELASGKKAARVTESGTEPNSPPQKPVQVLGVLSMSEPSQAADMSVCVDKLTHTIESLSVVAQSLSGISGRKTMLWIASGAPFSGFERPETFLRPDMHDDKRMNPKPNTADIQAAGSGAPSSSQQEMQQASTDPFRGDLDRPCDLRNDELKTLRPFYERTVKQLADANVAVYPVDARGIMVHEKWADASADTDTLKGTAKNSAEDPVLAEFWIHQSLQNFAAMTGASPCYHSNDFSNCMHDAVADSESYYLLCYYRDKKNDKPGWRSLKVKVNRPDVEVMARKGYFYLTDPQNTKEARQRDVAFALTSPVDFSGILFSVALKQGPDTGSKLRTLTFQLMIPPASLIDDPAGDHHMSFEVVAAASRPQGDLVDKFAKTLEGTLQPGAATSVLTRGLSYSDSLHLPPGDLTIRFVVRDNVNGRVGSVVFPYVVQ